MLGWWQVPAISEYDQLRIRNRLAQSKRIVEWKVIVLITPHNHRGRANQRSFALNPVRAPRAGRTNHGPMRIRRRQQMVTRRDHLFIDWLLHAAIHVFHSLLQKPARAEKQRRRDV